MKKRIKTTIIIVFVILILSLLITKVYAYFYTSVKAKGSISLEMDYPYTSMHKEVDNEGIHIYIENIGDYDCFVRVKVFSSASAKISYTVGDDWNRSDDGYWYYNKVLEAGQSTTEICIVDSTENVESAENIDIIAIHEITEVMHDENGEPYADWNHIIENSQT